MDNGTINEYICNRSKLRESEKLTLMRKVSEGIKYLHEEKFVHGDIRGVSSACGLT